MQNIDFLTKNLNPPQKLAVETLQGPVLILAGAGSGKTRVLTHRMARLVAEGHAYPEEILAVTFTNKAASEMEHRIYQLLNTINYTVSEPLWVTTFHSFCSRLLRQHITLLDYQAFFNIYDSQDQLQVIKRVLTQLNIDDKIEARALFATDYVELTALDNNLQSLCCYSMQIKEWKLCILMK